MGILVGTRSGLFDLGGRSWLDGREIAAVASEGQRAWVLADGRELLSIQGDDQATVATLSGEQGRCLQPIPDGVLVGTGRARLALVRDASVETVRSFDAAPGRDDWYTPWGGPPDTRSLSAGTDGVVFANVHVGGILRASAPEGPWQPTIDIDADVHQVLADPLHERHVVAATARGLAESDDGGDTWRFAVEGLHASYARAVALDGDRLFMSASIGPRGGRAALYRRDAAGAGFVRCTDGIREWFDANIDSHCVGAAAGTVAFGTQGGEVFDSQDAGTTWRVLASDLPPVTCLVVGPA